MAPKKRSSKAKRKGRGILDFFRSLGNRDTYQQAAQSFIKPYAQLKDAAVSGAKSLSDSTNWKNAFVNTKDTWETQTKPWLKEHQVISNLVKVAPLGTLEQKVASALAADAISKTGYGIRKKHRKSRR
jgi:hypothetical protein